MLAIMKALPVIYRWTMRRRLLYWYRQLKALERNLEDARSQADFAVTQAELERIDARVRRIRVPLGFSDQFYDLRGHIDLVRQRIGQRAPALRMAAE